MSEPHGSGSLRDRHTASWKESDAQDAAVLAIILRTDMHEHRHIPADSELARTIAVLARDRQDAFRNWQDQTNKVRAVLWEYYSAALLAFPATKTLNSATVRVLLRTAPTPEKAARLTPHRIKQLLRKAGRTRNLAKEARRLHRQLHSNTMRMPPPVEFAYGTQLTAMLSQLDAASAALDQLTKEAEELFATHPDAAIITSIPGLAKNTGARMLAEIGDDRTRFATAEP